MSKKNLIYILQQNINIEERPLIPSAKFSELTNNIRHKVVIKIEKYPNMYEMYTKSQEGRLATMLNQRANTHSIINNH